MNALNKTSGHKSPRECTHKAFVVHHDVNRLSTHVNGKVIAYAFTGNVFCFDCGMEFEPFRVRLVPKDSLMRGASSTIAEAHTTKQ